MRTYSYRYINFLAGQGNRVKVAKPFPGRNPLRLYLCIRIQSPRTGRWVTAYEYNGKLEYKAIKEAVDLRDRFSKAGVIVAGNIIEYFQNGVTHSGNIGTGNYFTAHRIFHYESVAHPNDVWRAAYGCVKEKPFRVNGKSTMVPVDLIPKLGDVAGLARFRQVVSLNRTRKEGGL